MPSVYFGYTGLHQVHDRDIHTHCITDALVRGQGGGLLGLINAITTILYQFGLLSKLALQKMNPLWDGSATPISAK